MFSNPTDSGADLESGKYLARIKELSDGDDYGNGPVIWWRMEIADEKGPILDPITGNPIEFSAMSSQSLGKKSKGRQWAEAFLQQSISGWTGQQVADALVGKVAKILVGPVPATDGVGTRQRVVSVEPYAPSGAVAQQPAPSAAATPPAAWAPFA